MTDNPTSFPRSGVGTHGWKLRLPLKALKNNAEMNATAKQLYQDALQLSDAERAELAGRLIESLDPKHDRDVEAAWNAEIKRRLEQLDRGDVRTVPWPEARRMIG